VTAPTHGIELFHCEPHRVRLTTKACAANWKMVNSGGKATMPGTAMQGTGTGAARVYGRLACVGCEVGEDHAAGKVVPVERLVWKAPPASSAPPPPPVTVVPRVEGVLDPKSAAPTAARMNVSQAKEEVPMVGYLARRAELNARREAVLADVLKKVEPISAYAARHKVDQATIRWWLEKEGHDPKSWPKPKPGPAPLTELRARAKASKPAKPSTPKEAIDAVHLDEPEPIELPPTPEQVEEALKLPDPPPRTMNRTELADLTLRDLLPVALVVPPRVGRILARLDVSSGVAHVAQCLYMAGLAQGRDDADLAKQWIDDACDASTIEHERSVERARRTRGAA
jgi:hypothetical protein